jgi:hypothetical protein
VDENLIDRIATSSPKTHVAKVCQPVGRPLSLVVVMAKSHNMLYRCCNGPDKNHGQKNRKAPPARGAFRLHEPRKSMTEPSETSPDVNDLARFRLGRSATGVA